MLNQVQHDILPYFATFSEISKPFAYIIPAMNGGAFWRGKYIFAEGF